MAEFSARVDLSPALARLTGQPQALVRRAGLLAAKRAAESWTDDIFDWIRAGRAFTPRTGALEQGIGWRATPDGALVYSQARHTEYVEFDTRPHVIRPRPGRKALRFFMGSPARAVFAGGVRHPGTKARPFFFADADARGARALDAAREAVAEVLLEASA